MAEGGRSRSTSKSPRSRTEDSIDPEQRRKYREAMGFEPWVSWSEHYPVSISGQDEWNEEKRKLPTTSSAGRHHSPACFDDEGNYLFEKKEETVVPSTVETKKHEELQLKQRLKRNQWKLERMKDSTHLECVICLDTILEKPSKWDRMFGLLPGCTHTFCLPCLVRVGAQHRCPLCRMDYSQIIPSPFYVKCPSQKQRMLAALRRGERERIKRDGCIAGAPVAGAPVAGAPVVDSSSSTSSELGPLYRPIVYEYDTDDTQEQPDDVFNIDAYITFGDSEERHYSDDGEDFQSHYDDYIDYHSLSEDRDYWE